MNVVKYSKMADFTRVTKPHFYTPVGDYSKI